MMGEQEHEETWPDVDMRMICRECDESAHDLCMKCDGIFCERHGPDHDHESRWLKMDTAPKDGTLFLAWVRNEDGDGTVRFVSWGKTSHVPLYGFCLRDQGAEYGDICKPTRWQHLPDPPKVD